MLRDEGVNIAVVVLGDSFADVRFLNNWERVLAVDPHADTDLLKALACTLRAEFLHGTRREEVLCMMEDSFSNTIRLSPWKACLTEDPESEIETLVAEYL